MFLLANAIIQTLIVIGSILLFIGTFLLNRKTKVPDGIEALDKCNTCVSVDCVVKTSDIETIKNELREKINDCEENDEKN